jgi:hypothetical protein
MKSDLLRSLFLVLLPFTCFAQSQGNVFDRDLEKVADGVYLAFRPEPLRNYVEGNSVIIV